MPHSSVQAILNALSRRARRGGDPVEQLLRDLHYSGVPAPELEYRFHPERKWRFDLAWPAELVAVEVEGLVYSNRGDNQLTGRHVSVSGFKKDIEKYGASFALGWNVLRITSAEARNGVACAWLVDHFKASSARAGATVTAK